jgi:hypothetical protein
MKKSVLYLSSLFAFLLIFGSSIQAQVIFYVEQPSSLSRSYELTYSSANDWGADLSVAANAILGEVVLVDDGTTADSLGCEPYQMPSLVGKIAAIYRGVCQFGQKAKNAQDAGAIGVIIINGGPANPGPDELLNMAAGDLGAEVTIPVVMISKSSGATLKSAIDAGELVVFIGTKTGKYGNDLGMFASDVVIAKTQAIPLALASSGNMSIPLGAFITNFGTINQSNVRLKATITNPANQTIYDNVSASGVEIESGSFAFLSLPAYTVNVSAQGTYTINYSVVYNETDEFPGDNEISSTFFVTEDFYAKTRINADTKYPILQGGTRFNEANGHLIKGCILMTERAFGGMKVHAISASATTDPGATLDGRFLEFDFYEYGSYMMATNGDLTFTDLKMIGSPKLFDYVDTTLQNRFVTVKFDINLENNKNYMACAATGLPDMFLGFDRGINYDATLADDEAVSAVNNIAGANQWMYWGGSYTPAIIVHISNNIVFETGDGTSSVNQIDYSVTRITPYPNPASSMVNIPLKEAAKGKVVVAIHDISGKLIRTVTIENNNSKVISLDAAGLENGVYYFQLNVNNEVTAFPVVISK